jgi:hypothetical protein
MNHLYQRLEKSGQEKYLLEASLYAIFTDIMTEASPVESRLPLTKQGVKYVMMFFSMTY